MIQATPIVTPFVHWTDPSRVLACDQWLASLQSTYGLDAASLHVASADASFRRYLRVQGFSADRQALASYIIMDAPPDKENSRPFVDVAAWLGDAGIAAPRVLAWDEAKGFMLLTDLGDQTMMAAIDPQQPERNLPLYIQALDLLVQMQLATRPGALPPYNEALLRRELQLFPDWYIAQHRQITLSDAQSATLTMMFDRVVAHNLKQPTVDVHRDFMPRNLMVQEGGSLAMLDFQDAVHGPITYDIASLMRDAFLSWDEEFVLEVTIRYWERARKASLPVDSDFGAFYHDVQWMGLQRHLKVAGIFARLTLRDGKPKYLADAPRFIHYIRQTASRYIELKPLLRLVDELEQIELVDTFEMGRG